MNPRNKKILFILIPIVVILIILTILALLYFTTDFLKSNQTLFLKYASQNIDAAVTILDNTSEKEYTKMLQQNKYESNSELTAEYVENANTSAEDKSNNINKLKLQINGQTDYQNSYDYKDLKIIYDDQDLFRTEYIQDGNIYGIKFSDIFNQFSSAENSNLKELAEKCGLAQEQIEQIPNTIEPVDINALLSFTQEQTSQLQTTYLNILLNNISSDSYSKQKNALITVNENSITTNAYTLKLTQEQANNIYIKLLEQLKNDEIILNKITEIGEALLIQNVDEIKENYTNSIEEKITYIKDNNIGTNEVIYTVYQADGNTVRTTIENNEKKIVIDLNKTVDAINVNIEKTIASELDENTQTIKIFKSNTPNKDELSVEFQNTIGQEVLSSKIYRNKTVQGSAINVETGITYEDGNSSAFNAKYNKDVSFVSEVNHITLVEGENNITLNKYNAEQVQKILLLVNEELTKKWEENQELISSILPNGTFGGEANLGVEIEQNDEISEIEKNRFNSKFEFYTGKDVTNEDIAKLLDVAKDNLGGAQVSYSEDETSTATSSRKKLQSIRLKIEKDKQNKELADSVMDLIETNKKYTIAIQYDENINVVSYITISVNE